MSRGDPVADEIIVIERLVPGGAGLGRLGDGRPVFVPGAFGGDRLRARDIVAKKGFVEVKAFELESPSPDRRTVPCAVQEQCGGCNWMGISEQAQERSKVGVLEQALRRTGRLETDRLHLRVHASPRALGYRTRARLQIANGQVGFFARGSHDLVALERCAVMTPSLAGVVDLIRQTVAQDASAFSQVEYVEARAFSEDDTPEISPSTCAAHFVFRRGTAGIERARELKRATAELARSVCVRLGSQRVEPQAFQPLHGTFVYSFPGGFTQVNPAVNRLLIERVQEVARQAECRSFLDLYCGSGNFALPLAALGLSGVGVEENPEAIESAKRAALEQNVPVEFFASSCRQFLAQAPAAKRAFDLVLLDPPRAGAKDILTEILRLKCRLLVMISCDPATLARDLRILVDGGYRLQSAEGYDMFPQTHHVESLAVLVREESARLSRVRI